MATLFKPTVTRKLPDGGKLRTKAAKWYGQFRDGQGIVRRVPLDSNNDTARLLLADHAGRVADFHALRHTFISNLARGGVHPKLAQALARHSTVTLTMDRYTHTVIGEQADALTALPDLSGDGPETERQRATGTDDSVAPIVALPVAQTAGPSLAERGRDWPLNSAHGGKLTTRERAANPGKQSTSGRTGASVAATGPDENGEGGIRTRAAGMTPQNGLANRRFQPLSHLSRWTCRPPERAAPASG